MYDALFIFQCKESVVCGVCITAASRVSLLVC
jgi:hypothetical protein